MEDLLFKGELVNDELERLIKAVKADRNTENTAAALAEAERASFLVAVTFRDGGYGLNVMSSDGGGQYLCAYTSTAARDAGPSRDCVTSSFYDMADLMNDGRFALDGIILNPGSDDLILGAELLIKMVEQTDDSIRVGEPNMYPPLLKDKIREFVTDQPSVEEVYVRFYVKKKSGNKGWLFVLKSEGSDEQKQYVYEMFKHNIEPTLDGLTSIILDFSLEHAQQAVKGVGPFFRRGEE